MKQPSGENASLIERLLTAYRKVELWPENRMDKSQIESLGTGFTDLLDLRNIAGEAADAIARADERIASLEAIIMEDAKAIGRSAEACMDMMNQRDEARTRAEAAERELEKAREALEWIAENSGDTYETNKGPFWVPDEAADRARAALEGKG